MVSEPLGVTMLGALGSLHLVPTVTWWVSVMHLLSLPVHRVARLELVLRRLWRVHYMLGMVGIQRWCPLEKECGVTVYIVVFVVIVLLSSVPPRNDPDTGTSFRDRFRLLYPRV